MSRDVSRVGESGSDLLDRERVLFGDDFHGFTRRDCTDDGGDVNPCSGEARLPEADVGIHRDARKDFMVWPTAF